MPFYPALSASVVLAAVVVLVRQLLRLRSADLLDLADQIRMKGGSWPSISVNHSCLDQEFDVSFDAEYSSARIALRAAIPSPE